MKTTRLRSSSFDRGRQPAPPRKIRVGICARDKKTHSKPMTQILQRFDTRIFDIVIFGDDTIINQPIEKWPVVDSLMSWYSTGFPLEKAQAYVRLREPFCINNLSTEHILRDRRKFYAVLEKAGIPTPQHLVVSRDGIAGSSKVIESEDAIEVNGVRISKPFVEKPVDAEDHNIYIYYPRRLGGGSKRLFRKVGNVSSRFYPEENNVRSEGSYIYEEFIMTQGTDIKIYSVGPDYGHAEARKSPVVDGIVQRDDEGKEVRFPIMLTNQEKDTVRRVCLAFKQNVCGFDLLRTPGKSYVCDVNGWSFVKKSHKYYDDASQLLMLMMIRAVAPERLHSSLLSHTSPPAGLSSKRKWDTSAGQSGAGQASAKPVAKISGFTEFPSSSMNESADGTEGGEELRCVAAIIRHGDRTPKQKMKVLVTHADFLALHKRFAKNPREECKLKSATQLQQLLEVTRQMIASRTAQGQVLKASSTSEHSGSGGTARFRVPPGPRSSAERGNDTESEGEGEHAMDLDKLIQMKEVLEKGGHFSGINRKVQLKPTRWVKRTQEEVSVQVTALDRASTSTHAGTGERLGLVAPPPPNDREMPLTLAVGPDASGQQETSASAAGSGKKNGKTSESAQVDAEGAAEDQAEVVECLLVLKWGGVLTHAGVDQSESLGQRFRSIMYPGESVGLLRLHSTYRHDLKIYSSDEGRVQMTAASFVKGFLDLEGELTPILASLVKTVNTSNLLDDSDPAHDVMMSLKKRLKKALTTSVSNVAGLPGSATDSEVESAKLGMKVPRVKPVGSSLMGTPALATCADPTRFGDITAGSSPLGQSSGSMMNGKATSGSPTRSGTDGPMGEVSALREVGLNGEAEEGAGNALSSLASLDLPSLAELRAIEAELKGPLVQAIAPTRTAALLRALKVVGPNPVATLHRVYHLISSLTAQLAVIQDRLMQAGRKPADTLAVAAIVSGESLVISPEGSDFSTARGTVLPPAPSMSQCEGESLWLMLERWRKLQADFYNGKKDRFDLSKVPDVYDCIKYDAVHNASLGLEGVRELYTLVKAFADLIVSQEYGMDVDEKADIAARIAHHLLRKVFFDMTAVTVEDTLEIQANQAARVRAQALNERSAAAKSQEQEVLDQKEKELNTRACAVDGVKTGSTLKVEASADSGAGAGFVTNVNPIGIAPVAPSGPQRVVGASGEVQAALGVNCGNLTVAACEGYTAVLLNTTDGACCPPVDVTSSTNSTHVKTVPGFGPPSSPMLASHALVHRQAHVGHVTGPTPVPLGTSVSSSKALEYSPVVGLVVSLHQHPTYAYTRRVRRKSAPSLLLPGMHRDSRLVDGHTGAFGRLHANVNSGALRLPLPTQHNACEAGNDVGPRSITVRLGRANSRAGTVPGSEIPSGSTLSLDMTVSTLDADEDGRSTTMQSPASMRDTAARGTVLVPGKRLRQRAAAAAAANSSPLPDPLEMEGSVGPPMSVVAAGEAGKSGPGVGSVVGATSIGFGTGVADDSSGIGALMVAVGGAQHGRAKFGDVDNITPKYRGSVSQHVATAASMGALNGDTSSGPLPLFTPTSSPLPFTSIPTSISGAYGSGSGIGTETGMSPSSNPAIQTASAMDLLAEDMHDIAETVHQLDARVMDDAGYGAVKTPHRHVRTRLYFTSESHVHALVNTLKYWALKNGKPDRDRDDGGVRLGGENRSRAGSWMTMNGTDVAGEEEVVGQGRRSSVVGSGVVDASEQVKRLVTEEGRALLDATPELDYLTHIVFRLYENFNFPHGHAKRHRVEILFSPGTAFSPFDGTPRTPRLTGDDRDVPSSPFSLKEGDHPQDAHAHARMPQLSLATDTVGAGLSDFSKAGRRYRRSSGALQGVEGQGEGEGGADGTRSLGTSLDLGLTRVPSSSGLDDTVLGEHGTSGTLGASSVDGSTRAARFLSTAVKPPAAFTGPVRATSGELLSHTLPVAPLLPLHVSLSLDDFEDILAEAIYSGANLELAGQGTTGLAASGLPQGSPQSGSGLSEGSRGRMPGPQVLPAVLAARHGVGADKRAGGATPGLGGAPGPGVHAEREPHPKEEAKARVAQAAARYRRNMGEGYFMY